MIPVQDVVDLGEKAGKGKWLGEELESATLDLVHLIDVHKKTGDDEDGEIGPDGEQFMSQIDSVSIGHGVIGDQKIDASYSLKDLRCPICVS
jgi:hypothetical protein